MRLNYSDAGLHAASFPVNPCCMSRPYESCRGMADTDAKNGNCQAGGNMRAAQYVHTMSLSSYETIRFHCIMILYKKLHYSQVISFSEFTRLLSLF